MKRILLLAFLAISISLSAQINYTANDQVPEYNGNFGYGVNFGSNAGWDDEAEADIAAGNPAVGQQGVGCNTVRPPLPEWFLEFWGYDIRLDEYQYFESLGMSDLTVFVGDPSDEHRDPNSYCPGYESLLFDNMYLPIWDNGENGTPVNDDNHYAIYLYDMVNIYKDHVTFWEIMNEPDFDYSASGFLDPGQPGNWWEGVPDPCDYKLRAPVYHYIRLLRISYEVIKYVDPESFVAVGGLGYESFLDIILRHSDNPDNGIVTAEFPLTGGAYFDAVSYHSYPHFSLKDWNNDIGAFDFFRYSDAAMQEVINKKNDFEAVLDTYGYDGSAYPEKVWLITESNVPAGNFNPDFFGSVVGQRNFVMKTAVACQKNNILQYHIYKLAEDFPIGEGENEFDRMGLYENMDDVGQYNQVVTESGIAYKTISDAIGDAFYNEPKTTALNLPSNIDGAAFKHPDDSYTYVLWAKTDTDQSEFAAATYSFPAAMNVSLLEKKNWNYSQTNSSENINATNIALSGAPIFLHDISILDLPPTASFDFSINSNCAPYTISFNDNSTADPTSWNWSFPGGTPSISNLQNPTVTYPNPGNYTASLLVANDFGNDASDATFTLAGNPMFELNEELCFGGQIIVNGVVYNESNPSGTEILENAAANGCDSIVIVNLSFDDQLESETFAIICNGETYTFGSDNLSESGTYTLETSSSAGCDSTAILYLTVETSSTFTNDIELCEGEEYNGQEYEEDTTVTETITSMNGCDSLINITNIQVLEEPFTELEITILNGETYTVGNSTYDESGVYYDILTAQNGCDSIIELTLTVDIVDAISDLNNPDRIELKAFPNPFSNQVNISFLATRDEFIGLEVYHINGQQIRDLKSQKFYQNDRYLFTLDFNAKAKGIYWCKVQLKEGVFLQKLILL